MGVFLVTPIAVLFSIHQPMLRHAFILCIRTPVISIRINGNTTAWSKNACNFNIFRIHQANQVFHYNIHTIFVESTMIAKTEKVQFQALAFHHLYIRNITDTDFCKVRLPGYRTQAGEFRTIKTYPVIILGMLIIKSFQHFRSLILLIFCFSSQKRQLVF